MANETKLYILEQVGAPLVSVDAELGQVGAYDCLVDVICTSVCGTQVGEIRGMRGPDKFLPHCMGHEGVGKIRSVGSKVDRLMPNDLVYLTWIPCDATPASGKKHWSNSIGKEINSGPIASFAKSIVCSSNRLFPVSEQIIDSGISLDPLAPLGCAYATAYGIVKRTARLEEIEKTDKIAVVGAGGVGLATLLFLGLSGFKSLVVFELDKQRQQVAVDLVSSIDGCIVTCGEDEIIEEFSRVIECSGSVAGSEHSFNLTSKAGICVLAGNIPFGSKIAIDPFDFLLGKRIVGAGNRNCIPAIDFPEIEELVLANAPLFERLVTVGYNFENLNKAIFDFEFGSVQRPVIRCN